MAKNYIFTGSAGTVVVTEGVGNATPVTGKGATEIEKLVAERRRLGTELTKKLKEHGFVTASDEDTAVTED